MTTTARTRSSRLSAGASLLGLFAGLLFGSATAVSCNAETCADCAQEKCSAQIDVCVQDADCQCVYDCIGNSGVPDIDKCLSKCDVTERPAGYADLEDCAVYGCPDEDECSSNNVNPAGEPAPSCDYTAATGAALSDGTLADCSFDATLPFDADGPVLQLESADKNTCVRIERRDDGNVDNSVTWKLLSIRVGTLGAVSLVEDDANACYKWSHHNFKDVTHAWTGSRHFDVVVAEQGHNNERYFELRAFEQGPITAASCGDQGYLSECDTPISEPIPLFPVNP